MRIDRRSLIGGCLMVFARRNAALGAYREQELPRRVAIMAPAVGAILHTTCIHAPAVSGLWDPDVSNVRDADSRLASFLRRQERGPFRLVLKQHYRQYIGILVEGERVLYVNGFSVKLRRRLRELVGRSVNWRTTLLDICDGGYGHWRAEYDLQAGEWKNFQTGGFG